MPTYLNHSVTSLSRDATDAAMSAPATSAVHASLARVTRREVAAPLPLLAGGTFVVGLAAVVAGVALATAVYADTLRIPWVVAGVAAWSIVIGGQALIRGVRLLQDGLASISNELGPIAAMVRTATPSARGMGNEDDGPEMDIEHAAWVQILLVGVAAVAVLIACSSSSSLLPWPALIPVVALAWPAIVRIRAARLRQHARLLRAQALTNQLSHDAIERLVRGERRDAASLAERSRHGHA